MNDYSAQIQHALPSCLIETTIPQGKKYLGKVRDTYDLGDTLLMITTDRLTAFDRHLTCVPYKGQVLNQCSTWWFAKTKPIVDNHIISMPDPNVILAKKCKVFPIEVVVRGYITGTTSTSLWTQYHNGVRNYCGNILHEGLQKNQKLEKPMLTPTTKDIHDKPISPQEIVEQGFMTAEEWDDVSQIALKLYQFGAEVADKHGLILVDTKYEFGRDKEGKIILVDEIHTPDSSRYWLASSYKDRFAAHLEPENIDKEFVRLWFAKNCDPYKDAILPKAPEDLIITLASRYIQLYELITGNIFQLFEEYSSIEERIQNNLQLNGIL